jgi:hypothetical protein
MNISVMKRPSAFVPPVMSFAALAMVLGSATMFGVVHEADEGTAAHVFQLLMSAQAPKTPNELSTVPTTVPTIGATTRWEKPAPNVLAMAKARKSLQWLPTKWIVRPSRQYIVVTPLGRSGGGPG